MTPHQDGSRGFAAEVERLAATLKPAQRTVLADLAERGADELTRAEYERIGLVSRSQAAYDLAELVQMGLLERIGSGRATQYRRAHPGAGRKRRWTDERIRAELEAFCAGRPDWPRALDFKAAGRGDLYLAASRYGGIEHWAAELGYGEVAEAPASPPRAGRQRRRVPIAGIASRALHPAVLGAAVLSLSLAAGLTLAADMPEGDTWRPSHGTGSRAAEAPSPPPPAARRPAAASALASRRDEPSSTLLTLRAVRGSSWVTVRRDSARGRILFVGTLARGTTARLRGARLWVRFGEPWNLDARIGSETIEVRRVRTGIVTSRGLRVTARAQRPQAAPRERQPAPSPGTVGPTAVIVSARTASPLPAPPPAPPPPAPAPSGSPGPDPLPTSASGANPAPDSPPRP